MYDEVMSDALAVGLVGLGVHGERYAQHLLHDVPGARLAAVCRMNVESGASFARRHGVLFFSDWRQMIAHPSVEAVSIVTPSSLTPSVALAALAAGKAVLAEKPLADSREAGLALVSASASGPPLMVAQTMRWDATVTALKGAMPALGDIRIVALAQRLEEQSRMWLDQEDGGDALLNTGVHAFDLLRFLTGREVESVWCMSQRVATRVQPDTFVAGLTMTGGLLATVDNCRASGARAGRMEVVGANGTLVGDHVHGLLARQQGRQMDSLPVGSPVHTVQEVLIRFVAVARGEMPPPVTAEDGWRAVEIALACRHSAACGLPVSLKDPWPGP